jgi:hypothetical protein
MNRLLLLVLSLSSNLIFQVSASCQGLVPAAQKFINLLDSAQKARALYPFDTAERYGFHYFPIDNRKGIPMDQLNADQSVAAMDLIRTCLTEETVKKIRAIMQLELVLIEIEHRKPDDHFRDPGKYFLTIFGVPGNRTIWGWRLEGHHVSFNFSANDKKLVAGTPGFLGANPAIVQQGDQKGKEVLKDEKEMGFALLRNLSADELKKAIVDTAAPGDIVTYINRKAMIEHPSGLLYTEMNSAQQQQLLQLISLYVHRFTKLFADNMLKEIQAAGVENLRFAWMGQMESGPGHPHYYRIQGPTLIIEYDNTQNNANHVHTVVRDLLHDYGGDALLEHYKQSH